ncbi:MAG: energy-coupling factor ABC transporter permease [Geminocystis sp.]|nr:energy-coupling factor ABC transporter permease [Geminocystis sp.]HIK36940.1 energy-coupling factor ABC transporter permease [Geminocystis sp. M7585_C2015_104]
MSVKYYRRALPLGGAVLVFFSLLLSPSASYAMHISEGFLPFQWAALWWVLTIPFLVLGYRALHKITKEQPELKLLLALAAAFGFLLSALKIPSVTGSCSHPTGIGLGTILFGPSVMSIIGFLVLVFQALLLAHGGLTTLGANAFAMAIAGNWSTYVIYIILKKTGREKLAIFLAVALGSLFAYLVTSVQLAIAFPAAQGGIVLSFMKFAGIFALTQIPLSISEGLLTVMVWNWINAYAAEDLERLKPLSQKGLSESGETGT